MAMNILRGLISYAISTVTGRARPLSVNGSDELIVNIGSTTGTLGVDVEEIAGAAVAATSVAGTMPVETDHRQVAGSAMAATSVAGMLPVENDQRQIGGVNVATGNIAGSVVQEGTQADNAVHDGSFPINVGGKVSQNDPSYADTDKAEVSFDMDGYIRILDKAFDTLTTSNQNTNLNPVSIDRDTAGQIDADETDIGAGTINFPSDDGRLYGTRNKRCWTLTLDDVTSCELQESDDGGVTWVPVTASLEVRGTGLKGYPATYFTAPDGSPITYKVQMETPSAGIAYRWQVVINATNDILITTSGRAN